MGHMKMCFDKTQMQLTAVARQAHIDAQWKNRCPPETEEAEAGESLLSIQRAVLLHAVPKIHVFLL